MLPSCLSATVLTIPKYPPLAFTIRIATVLPEQDAKPDSGGIIQGHNEKKSANKNDRNVTTRLLFYLCHTRVCMPTTRMQ